MKSATDSVPAGAAEIPSPIRHAGYACQLCSSDYRLEVHHKNYERLGEERSDDLAVLCHTCHSKHHNITPVVRKKRTSKGEYNYG